MMQQTYSANIPGSFLSKDSSGAYDLVELDQTLFHYFDGQDPPSIQDQRQMRPPTLNIFPSQPMHVEPSSTNKMNTGLVSPVISGSKRSSQPSMELSSPKNNDVIPYASGSEPPKAAKREGNRKGLTSSSEQDGQKTPDPKTLKRLAQNTEAAQKRRLRKKAYVQPLESSRIRLTQLEQELQRDRAQIIVSKIEPLTEDQFLGICGLQQSTQQAEDTLSQGFKALNHSLSNSIASDALHCPQNMANYMGQMALPMNKLSTLEGFVKQEDNLRQQTIHRLHQLLMTRQAARCFLAIAEYFHRLRALSSLWLARPTQE